MRTGRYLALTLLAAGCVARTGEGGGGGEPPPPGACAGVDCSGHGTCAVSAGAPACACDPGYLRDGATACVASASPSLGGCGVFPPDHVFNTAVDGLPVHPSSAAFLATVGAHSFHLDLGRTVDQSSDTYYGIPYNLVHGGAVTWTGVAFSSATEIGWDPRPESDCAAGSDHALVSPCTAGAVPAPVFPVPAAPLVEGGISAQPAGDHHLLLLDVDACRLWELYVAHQPPSGWQMYGAASFDLGSSALRPDGWTSADAAGFPILPLLLRADEASAGVIRHALRFTIQSSKIREAHAWPARHDTHNGGSSTAKPPMGQLFRLRASYAIPAGFHAQSRAILQAMKTYGLYVADGGSDLYVTGEPSAAWDPLVLDEVQSVGSDQLEAVDVSGILARPGFDADSGRVPPP